LAGADKAMAFKYIAYNPQGTVIKGSMTGPSEVTVKEAIRQWGYEVLSLKFTNDPVSWQRQLPSLFKVKSRDVIIFSRLLATLVGKGTNLLVALQLIRDETSNVVFRDILESVIESILNGKSLSDAMSQHPEVFSLMYCRMIKVSEQTGNLEGILGQVADFLEKENALLSKVARALAYPGFVMLIAAGVVALLITFVLPSFGGLFSEFEAQIPLPTRILMSLSEAATNNKWYCLLGLLTVASLGMVLFKHPRTRHFRDSLLLKTPILGSIMSMSEMARFSRVIAMGLREGLQMPEILNMASGISRNQVVTDAIGSVHQDILAGQSLTHALSKNPVFPRLIIQLVRVGEVTANLDESLESVAEAYEVNVERKVTLVVALIEPSVILFIGLIVAFIAVSVILPTYAILGEF
jgi:type IV pilus assembly protein PilC